MRYDEFHKKSRTEEILDNIKRVDENRRTIPINNRETADIDGPHVTGQQRHAHLSDNRVVNQDGTHSHGDTSFQLTKDEANALRRQKFNVPKNRLIESEDQPISVELEPPLLELLLKLKKYLD